GSILAPAHRRVTPDDGGSGEDAHDDEDDVRGVVVTRTLDHDLGVLGALNYYFLHVSSLLRTSRTGPDPDGTKNGTSSGHWKQRRFRFATAITRPFSYVTPCANSTGKNGKISGTIALTKCATLRHGV